MSESLKSCPFCGGNAAFATITYGEQTRREQDLPDAPMHYVSCTHCAANTLGIWGSRTTEDAAHRWNSRAEPARVNTVSDGKERPWTPGPLRVVCTEDTAGAVMIETLDGDPLAHVLTTAADAHRFAAAPDLYEALRRLVELKDTKDRDGATTAYQGEKVIAWSNARLALSRATQEEET